MSTTSGAATKTEEPEETSARYLHAAQLRFRLGLADDVVSPQAKEAAKAELFNTVQDMANPHFYQVVCSERGFPVDESLASKMKSEQDEKLKEFDVKIADAKESFGENEVREAMLVKAHYLAKTGSKDVAVAAFDATLAQPKVTTGQKMDIVFAVIRLGLFWEDLDLVKKNIDKAKLLIEEGGDWERRNRLKVYEATYLMAVRNFRDAATLYLDSISTFTATELFKYDTFVFYTVVTSVASLDRQILKKRVIDAPEVLQVVHGSSFLLAFLNGMYNCEYKKFFHSLVDVVDSLKQDRFLAAHARFLLRECRVRAYMQFLQSYKSVRIDSMAASFGVGVDFLDRELGDFVSSKRLTCKIDRESGIVESNRPDTKNASYAKAIKDGDELLNRIQKLGRVITL